jgi:hypothetical protein
MIPRIGDGFVGCFEQPLAARETAADVGLGNAMTARRNTSGDTRNGEVRRRQLVVGRVKRSGPAGDGRSDLEYGGSGLRP